MKSSGPKSVVPAFAKSQKAETLKMLRAAGTVGVSKATLLYEKHWSQVAARISELEDDGFQIKHAKREGETYVRYILESEPLELKPPEKSDWYERTTGKPRTQSAPEKVSDLPLFSGGDR
jgi:hypothetical protein